MVTLGTLSLLCPCQQENLATACENIQRMRADMGGTNVLSPLKWITRQPVHRGHPRLLFLITDGAVSDTGKVLELVRSHAFSTRSVHPAPRGQLGPGKCFRLLDSGPGGSEGLSVRTQMPTEGCPPPAPPEARAACEVALLDHALSLSPSGDKDGREHGKEQFLSSPPARCYSFGIGPNVCHRLVKGLATVSKGSAEFLVQGERLQPKVGARVLCLSWCWSLRGPDWSHTTPRWSEGFTTKPELSN